jgi:hypothetical protein
MTNTDPTAFANDYHNITWTQNGTFSASVRKYLSQNAEACDKEKIKGAKTAKTWLLEDLGDEEKATQEGERYRLADSKFIKRSTIDDAFAGRATPDQLKQTLWLATYFGYIVTADKAGKSKKCTAQQFADWYLGMDCTGFVSAFFGIAGGKSIERYDKDVSKRRRAVGEIRHCDVMIRKEGEIYKHIALVETASPRSGGGIVLKTAESVGGSKGVTSHVRRELVVKSPGVFALASGGESEFYIYPGR